MWRQILLTLSLLFWFFSSVEAQVKIMPLGNSITQADSGHNSYRYFLDQLFNQASFTFDFVGSHDSNYLGYPALSNFDKDNEGHWGWTADEIVNGRPGEGKLSDWIKGYQVDAALIHIGTNDIFANQGIVSTLSDVKQIIDTLRAEHPNVVVFLAKLIPTSINPVRNANITRFNDSLPNLALQNSNASSPIIIVDQNTGFNPAMGMDTYDTVHPNDSGAIKMANKWYQAVTAYYLPLSVSSLNLELKVTVGGLDFNWEYLGDENIVSISLQESYLYLDNWIDINSEDRTGYSNGTFNQNSFPNGPRYYRLLALKEDGTRVLSNVKTYVPNSSEVLINYQQSSSFITLNSTSSFEGSLRLLDPLGRIIIEKNISVKKGITQSNINTTSLSKGIYWLQLSGTRGTYSKSIFISEQN